MASQTPRREAAQRESTAGKDQGHRWRARPRLGAIVRLAAFALPIVAGVLAAIAIDLLLPTPTSTFAAMAWWVIFIGGVGGSAICISRLARRLFPLAALLKLTLTFPDHAPSRLAVARAAGRTRDLRRRVAEVRRAGWGEGSLDEAIGTLLALVSALTAHDRGTRGHSERVRALVDLLAEELSIPPEDRERLRWAALLHDIGKLEVDSDILNKPGQPDKREWAELKKHPATGMKLADPLLPWLGAWAGAIQDHHERYDGTGYPNGASGGDISFAGRILAVADSFETMTATRAYKKPMTPQAARRELVRCSGAQFDPFVVRHLLNASIGKLWWIVGIGTALMQIPALGALSRHGITEKVGRQAAAVTGVGATIASLSMAGLLTLSPLASRGASTPDPSAHAQTASPNPSVSDGRIATSQSPHSSTPDRPRVADEGDAPAGLVGGTPPQGGVGGNPAPSHDAPPASEKPEPVDFTRYGRIRLFAPLYPHVYGATQREFLMDCAVPSSQGADGWVFELPEQLAGRRLDFFVHADPAVGPHDLDVQLYSDDCELLGEISSAPDESGTIPLGTRFVFVAMTRGVDALVTLEL